MGTRSNIGYKKPDGKIVAAYCHWDGYPSHHGKILLANYNTAEKVKELVSGGNISILAERCDKPDGHSFENPVTGHTVYYGRDRGETEQSPTEYADEAALLAGMEEYAYIFTSKGWIFSDHGKKFKKLTKKACVD